MITAPTMNVLMVGGYFDESGGRASGYFKKLADAFQLVLPRMSCRILNGGSLTDLNEIAQDLSAVTHLVWFADVPNAFVNLLPALTARYPGLVLVSSKNNRKNLYSHAALFARMRKSRSELLLEFRESLEGALASSVLTVQGDVLLDNSTDIVSVAACRGRYWQQLQSLVFPLCKQPFLTQESHSYIQLLIVIRKSPWVAILAHLGWRASITIMKALTCMGCLAMTCWRWNPELSSPDKRSRGQAHNPLGGMRRNV